MFGLMAKNQKHFQSPIYRDYYCYLKHLVGEFLAHCAFSPLFIGIIIVTRHGGGQPEGQQGFQSPIYRDYYCYWVEKNAK